AGRACCDRSGDTQSRPPIVARLLRVQRVAAVRSILGCIDNLNLPVGRRPQPEHCAQRVSMLEKFPVDRKNPIRGPSTYAEMPPRGGYSTGCITSTNWPDEDFAPYRACCRRCCGHTQFLAGALTSTIVGICH